MKQKRLFPHRIRQTAACLALGMCPIPAQAQNVGIGTTAPQAHLHVNEGNVAFTAAGDTPSVPGAAPVAGAGRRLLWYANKAAFRAGFVGTNQWDTENIGKYSVAMGNGTIASGLNSTAFGLSSTASGENSVALGGFSSASGRYSIALGYTTASGNFSTAMGYKTAASGWFSTATGYGTIASADYSTAVGNQTTATGAYSTAMGSWVSTESHTAAFIIGDMSSNYTYTRSSADNEFTARFANGYRLYTNSAANVGVSLAGGANSWATISDSTKKEYYQKADGLAVLDKIKSMRLGSWNYKGQKKASHRHYGPMAQEFYARFGDDGIGTIGNDTTIASADIDGVMMIAIKELILTVTKLERENEQLKVQGQKLNQQLNDRYAASPELTPFLQRLEKLEKLIESQKQTASVHYHHREINKQ